MLEAVKTDNQPSPTMTEELRRLIGNVSIAQQQFNEFAVYCRKELGLPDGWRLDAQKLEFVKPPEQKKDLSKENNGKDDE